MIDKGAIKEIITAAELSPDDIVLEIGPGIGNLTTELAKKAKKVITVEKDQNLAKILDNELRIMQIENVEVIQGDILKILDSKFIIHNSYKIIADLPFYLATPVIRQFLESERPPKEMILVVQKEVAQRICAKIPDMNLLAVSVQFYAKPKIISYISKKSFWPSPKVDSAILELKVKSEKLKVSRERFFEIDKAASSQPRIQLINNLSSGLNADQEKIKDWLSKNNIGTGIFSANQKFFAAPRFSHHQSKHNQDKPILFRHEKE